MKDAFKHWTSATGLKTLADLLKGEIPVSDIGKRRHIENWEWALIHQTMRTLRKRYRHRRISSHQIHRALRNLAEELEILRQGGAVKPDLIDRLENPLFKGKRSHFVRLIAFLEWEEGWNRWRRQSGEIPDLRSADLGYLNLGHIDLSRARLRGTNLSAAVIRTGNLAHADLRDCNLRHTDLSYADLTGAKLANATLTHTLLTDTKLNNADLRSAFLVGTSMNQADLRGADLTDAVVWGISTWDIKQDANTKQKGLYVVPLLEPLDYDQKTIRDPDISIRVNDLEVAHFVSLLMENPKIGRVINAAADKIVLLLGRFVGQESFVLEALKEKLPSYGYVPVVFDFDEPEDRDTIETVAILAGLSSFVIANLSKPRSTPLEAHLVIPAIAVPFVPLIREGERPFAMFTALQRKYPWVLPTVTYRDEANLLRKLKRSVIEPAEKLAMEMRTLKHPSVTL